MASSACVTQTIGSMLGSAATWAVAGDPRLHALDFFYTPERPGFGGRQAFSKGLDQFYAAVAAATELSFLSAGKNDPRDRHQSAAPRHAILAFPVVVVEGELYEAYFDERDKEIKLATQNRVRVHWRGASSWNLITSIDIVTLDHLDEFMRVRAQQTETLLSALHDIVLAIDRCFDEQSLRSLPVSKGPRGILGVPDLLQDLHMLDEVGKLSKSKTRRPSVRKTNKRRI
jgi:hypothetical protein